MMEEADAIIIGSSQGGIPLAADLAKEGRKVVLFERDALGGSCVNGSVAKTGSSLVEVALAPTARSH